MSLSVNMLFVYTVYIFGICIHFGKLVLYLNALDALYSLSCSNISCLKQQRVITFMKLTFIARSNLILCMKFYIFVLMSVS